MKKAFTLLELLIVLSILAVGVGLGLANLTQIQQKVAQKTLKAKLKQLQIAKQQFIQEWTRIEAADAWENANSNDSSTTDDSQAKYNLLKRYIERPINSFDEVAPSGYVITMPTSVTGTFTGYKGSDSSTTFSASDY